MIAFVKRYPLLFIILFYIILLLLAGLAEDIELIVVIITFFYTLVVVIPWVVWQIISAFRLKKELKQTELQHLKSQVNPHFFFNTLNLLYGMMEKDKKKARDLILKLSDLMRYSIYDGQKDQVTIKEEIDYLKQYIELQKARFHKEIKISFDVNVENEHVKLMPLLFIILVENAFKHGAENLREGAFIDLAISTDEKGIHFLLKNNFDPDIISEEGGIGLKNLKRRLELGYPRRHKFSERMNDGVYTAELTLAVV